jgi:hypothetical protein
MSPLSKKMWFSDDAEATKKLWFEEWNGSERRYTKNLLH